MTIVRALRIAVGFLTRIPVGDPTIRGRDLGRAVGMFPIVGFALGLAVGLLAWLLHPGLSPALTAVAVVAALALLTGGLHLDGVADVFDGLGGGRGDRDRILEIMRDSRIGSHGAAAIVAVMVAKLAAIGELIAGDRLWLLALAPAVARALVVFVIVALPYARARGLGSDFHHQAGLAELLAAAAALVVVCALYGAAILPLAVAGAGVVALCAVLVSQIGGMTGDGYGSAIEIAELLFLAGATLV